MKCQAITSTDKMQEQAEEIRKLRAQLTSTKVTLPGEVEEEVNRDEVSGDDDGRQQVTEENDDGKTQTDDTDTKMPAESVDNTQEEEDELKDKEDMNVDDKSTETSEKDDTAMEEDSTGHKSRDAVSYATAVTTPERFRKGRVNAGMFEYGGRSESGTGTQKKSNLSSNTDPQHQTNAIALDNSDEESQVYDDKSE